MYFIEVPVNNTFGDKGVKTIVNLDHVRTVQELDAESIAMVLDKSVLRVNMSFDAFRKLVVDPFEYGIEDDTLNITPAESECTETCIDCVCGKKEK